MDTIIYDKLLLKTAFCCMACDGHIDSREVDQIRELCSGSGLFVNFNFEAEINAMVTMINSGAKDFIQHYFDSLKNAKLTEEEEITVINFALKTIHADEKVEYSEVKFFKSIQSRLHLTVDKIVELYPETEYYLEDDIVNESYLERLVNQYFESVELPEFTHLTIAP